MRPMLQAFSRYRPRILTLVVLLVIVAVLVLANVTSDRIVARQPSQPSFIHMMKRPFLVHLKIVYGWPFIWHWDNVTSTIGTFGGKTDRELGLGRLVANVALWLLMAVAPAALCEWLLRRYRPRLRWSLRTMLVAVALIAALCAWFVAALRHADLQDALIAKMAARGDEKVWVEYWGPKWLDLLGANHFRRRIVGANMSSGDVGKKTHEDDLAVFDGLVRSPNLQFLELEMRHCNSAMTDRLSHMRLPHLQFLDLRVHCLTLGIADALRRLPRLRALRLEVDEISPGAEDLLGEMRQVRTLCLNLRFYGVAAAIPTGRPSNFIRDVLPLLTMRGDAKQNSRQCLSAVARMTQLEHLRLEGVTIDGKGLAALTNLKTLSLGAVFADQPSLLARLPIFSRLESLDLQCLDISGDDLRHLSRQPRLKSLKLSFIYGTSEGLAQLASVKSLEELSLDGDAVSTATLKSLYAIDHLNLLHIGGFEGEGAWAIKDGDKDAERWRRAFDALRTFQPGIVIDGNTEKTTAADNIWNWGWEYELAL